MTIGIYKLNFKDTNKVYIGKSLNIEKRYKDHLYLLRTGNSNYKLIETYRVFGIPTLEILCECSSKELNSTEEEAIAIFDAVITGCNILYSAYDRKHGEDNPNSLYTNDQIIESFLLLVNSTELTFREISKITKVSTDIISKISCSTVHNWLLEIYPNEYLKLKELHNTRNNKGELHYNAKYSNIKIEDIFLTIVNNPSFSMKEIAKDKDVTVCVVESIAKLQNHVWLKEKYPNEYSILESLYGNRRRGASIKNLGIIYPKIISPEGTSFQIENVAQFARDNNLDASCVIKVLKGIRNQHKGWKIEKQ